MRDVASSISALPAIASLTVGCARDDLLPAQIRRPMISRADGLCYLPRRCPDLTSELPMRVLISGSSGLIGSAAVEHYDRLGHTVVGVDNNQRRQFFGEDGDTTWNTRRLEATTSHFTHVSADIRDREAIFSLFADREFDLVIHCAAQPSHDLAARIPLEDFDVNAVGTLNFLEATRLHSPAATFLFMSTNKVYGDAPNEIPLVELATRFDYARLEDHGGITEDCRIDQSLHSLFGASKVAADILAQEYGRYFGLNVGVFRGGCLTGAAHSSAELHGFLAYLVKCVVHGRPYTLFGYNGKQVRDNIHSSDVVAAFDAFASNPRPGTVYNLGGGRANSVSVLEAIDAVERLTGNRLQWTYEDNARRGDHICYITDLSRFQNDYPGWSVTLSLDDILVEMVKAEVERT
jgi:CDP-paratose 2-epimerase